MSDRTGFEFIIKYFYWINKQSYHITETWWTTNGKKKYCSFKYALFIIRQQIVCLCMTYWQSDSNKNAMSSTKQVHNDTQLNVCWIVLRYFSFQNSNNVFVWINNNYGRSCYQQQIILMLKWICKLQQTMLLLVKNSARTNIISNIIFFDVSTLMSLHNIILGTIINHGWFEWNDTETI